MKNFICVSIACLIFAVGCKNKDTIDTNMNIHPPRADKIAKKLKAHNDIRTDNYYWLNNPEDEKVISYLEAENVYYEAMTAHTQKLKTDLFEEMKARIKEDDQTVPFKWNGYYYITRYETGKDYPIHTRKKDSLEAPEEILFDVNEMAKGHSYYNLKGLNVSEDNKLIAFGVDTLSRRKYDIFIKNLETGEIYSERIPLTTGSATWGNDNKTLFYTRKDEKTLRADRIYRHTLGTDPSEDVLVYAETDETFGTYVGKTKSKKYIYIGNYSTLTSEYRILDANNPKGEFKVFQPRERGLEYAISHFEDNWYILTNKDEATNFKVMKTPEDKTSKENWSDMIPHRNDVLVENVDIFKDYMVLSERKNGLSQLRIIGWDTKSDYYLPFDNETYTAYTTQNPEFNTKMLRYSYTSAENLYASGGSAGGLLMGAVANMAPELYNGIIASVPFVDVLTTMMDDSIPLTTGEYDEWGNPNVLEYYEYIKSYSPYDNVSRKDYPNMLVTTGLHDSQVQYWEPAKWVAKLRDLKTDSNLLLLQTNMDAGHGGASGRFEALKEVAMDFAFLLDMEGIKE